MNWNKLIITAVISLSGLFIMATMAAPSLYAVEIHIKEYSYSTHFRPGEVTSFSVCVKNDEPTDQGNLYINIVLTNHATGAEVSPYPTITTFTVPAKSSMWLTTNSSNWTAAKGLYTVTIILYGWADRQVHKAYGAEAIHVGEAEEFVSAFPSMIDFGTLPYGRYMYPSPVKINWSFYLKNQLRKDHPWYMRIYTDNAAKYKGIDSAIYKSRRAYTTSKIWTRTSSEGSPAGLVSSDGKYTLPLKVWCLNYGPDWDEIGWSPTLLGPPPVNEDYVWKGPLLDDGKRDTDRGVWLWVPDYMDMTLDSKTWRNLIGQDPFNKNYTGDNNPTGDFTLESPFDIYFATETSPATVIGRYSGKLIIEIYLP